MNDDWSEGDFVRRATQASNAFEDLRKQLRSADHRRLPEIGDIVGRYRLIKELGQGGFGSVFEVQHELLGHTFAMKLLNPRISSDPDWVARFREEARTTSLIGHENIVYVTDFGSDEQWGSYFVMEYLNGQPLDAIIADEGPLPADRVARFAHAAASAFSAVHEVGIVHCDLKPSNVFVIPRPRQPELWKFLDFGTATVVMATVETEALYGTPLYMAPEQAIGADVSPLSDQFSLACVLYEMLTGTPPWEVRNWLMATPEIRGRKPPTPPSELSPLCPKAWDDVVLRGLAIDAKDRWPSLEALARALEENLELDWKPSVDPLDVVRSIRHEVADPDGFARAMTAPSVAILAPAEEPSVVVDVDTGEQTDGRPVVRIEFRSRERFVREIRRNLSVGGLFVPSEELLSLRESVRVVIVFEPGSAECQLDANVVGHELRREAGRGFGLAFASSSREALAAFVEQVRVPVLSGSTVLGRTDEPVPDTLTPGEWFLLSRIEPGTTLKRLRSLCAGLPIELDDVIAELLARGLVVVQTSSSPSAPMPEAPPAPRTMQGEEIDAVLERVDFHRHQGNFLGASDVLARAIEMSPQVAVFHYRRALLQMEFDDDPKKALPSAKRARELDPTNAAYDRLHASLSRRV